MTGKSRLKNLYTYMEKEKIDLVFITLPRSVYYFTNFNTNPHERFFSLCVPLDEEPILIIPELDLEEATKKSNVKNIRTHKDDENPLDIIREFTKENVMKCGIQKDHLTLTRFEEIDSVVQARTYIDIEDEIQKMKALKSENEIEKIRNAIRISDLALSEALKIVKPGISEYELAAEIQYQRLNHGADGGGLMVVSGEKTAMPHGRTGNRVLQEGDFLLIDGGVIKDGYVSDITRTFAVGEITSEQKNIYNTVLSANTAAINAIRPGVAFGNLDKIAREIIDEEGYGQYFTHRLGHGMGMNNHEYPSIHGLNKDIAKVGMVFTIEPGIYIPDLGGVRIEDDIVVTKDGFEVLTNYPKELIIL